MELLARLENIAFYVKQLNAKCEDLENKNNVLSNEIERLQREIKEKQELILNLEETKKISKLAEGVAENGNRQEIKDQLDAIIREIDNCLVLVKI